ncbi:unnamed protein product [Cunninghamella blakesleeana]
MPFRCKCGRTFEKPDTFSSHTSACASFHKRRMSDISSLTSHVPANSNSNTNNNSSLHQKLNLQSSQPVAVPTNNNNINNNSNNTKTRSSRPQSVPSIYTSPLIILNPPSPTSPSYSSSSIASSPTNSDFGGTSPFFMPTGLSLHNAFEGARKRSMSYGSIFSK